VGSLGQNPGWDVPPDEEQELVDRQTPGVLPAVQGPFRAPCAKVTVRRTRMARIMVLKLVAILSGIYNLQNNSSIMYQRCIPPTFVQRACGS
jgi:hypothetical protein